MRTALLVVLCIALTACTQQPDAQACTLEALLCPDGTAVGRTGPNCSFAPCPQPTVRELDRTVMGTSEQCMTMKFMCIQGYEFYNNGTHCGCVQYGYPPVPTSTCANESEPVCGWAKEHIQCFAYPCASNYRNECEAQKADIAYYTKGTCPTSLPLATFTYQPKQCAQTPWDKWYETTLVRFAAEPTDIDLITTMYGEAGILVHNVQRIETRRQVCMACDCPTSHYYTLQAPLEAQSALIGWQQQ